MMELEQKAIAVLDAIADKLGTGVDHFWPLFVREQYIEGVTSLVIITFGLLSLLAFIYIALTRFRKSISEMQAIELMIVVAIIAIISAIALPAIARNGGPIGKILNPEYHALKAVLEMVK